jgi:hypothetical protein
MAEIRENRIGQRSGGLILLAMKHDPTALVLTPVIAAALQRAPRRSPRRPAGGGLDFFSNNYVAEGRGPDAGNRPGAGARPHNANAATASAELRALFAECNALCRSARRLLRLRRERLAR